MKKEYRIKKSKDFDYIIKQKNHLLIDNLLFTITKQKITM